MKFLFTYLGRMCLSFVFIFGAFDKLLNWEGHYQHLVQAIQHWITATTLQPNLQDFFQSLLPFSVFLLLIPAILEAVGGLLIFLGIKTRLGAFLLLLFILPTTILFHAFWFIPGPDREMQMILCFKNLSIAGGLLILIANEGQSKPPKQIKE